MKKNLKQVWDQLRGQSAHRTNRLDRVRIQGIRGIRDLTVELRFPVTVLAGPNACGKSTVLAALACAYRPPGSGPRDFVPTALFPDFRGKQRGLPSDTHQDVTELTFDYVIDRLPATMRWRRKKSWNRSGMDKSPPRAVYLRTLANLTAPSEVRSLLQIIRHAVEASLIDAADITLAHRILPWRYQTLTRLRAKRKDLLFASRADGTMYSEFHMSSGERSVLRLSLELSRLRGALVLIDEVEAGLHPFTQQVLMLELQRLSLRNDLQIVVASHSAVVLETVPPEARVFLTRDVDNVVVQPPHHDLLQRVLYGQALDKLAVVCEDASAEAVVRGVFDVISPQLGLVQGDVEVGRNTGKDEFKHHVAAFGRFHKLWSMVFVLDGDGRSLIPELEHVAEKHGQSARILCLPGDGAPELWAWHTIRADLTGFAAALGCTEDALQGELDRVEAMYDGAADTPSNKAKGQVYVLADTHALTVEQLLRLVSRREAERGTGALSEVVDAFRDAVSSWRNMRGDF